MNLKEKSKITRILIVSYGSIGKRHLGIARKIYPNSNIKILRSLLSKDVPQKSNGIFNSVDEAIFFQPDIAIIANPATHHIDIAQKLAENGVNILIEKPISSSSHGVKLLIKTMKKNNLTLLVGYNLRFSESLEFYKEQLEKGMIGKVLSVRCEVGQYLPSWRPDSKYKDSVSARSELGGGVLLELSHELDSFRWIFGEIQWVKSSLSRQSSLDINVEDCAHIILGFEPVSDGSQIIGSINLDFIRHDTTRTYTAIGEKGSLKWDAITGEVMLYKSEANEWTELVKIRPSSDETYIAEWKNFIDSIQGGAKPKVTGEDGLKVLNAIDAIRKSSENNTKEFVIESSA